MEKKYFSSIEKALDEFKTEIYKVPTTGKLNVSLTSTFDAAGNQMKEFPPEWRLVVKDILNAIVAVKKEPEFAKNDVKNIDVVGAVPTGNIQLQNDSGKR